MHPFAMVAAIRGRLRAILRRGRVEQELEEEIRFHLEMETDENIARGMSPADARSAALRAFGNAGPEHRRGVDAIRELHREARGTRWLGETLTDMGYAARALRQSPAFVAVSVFTLAIAIAVGTSLFTAVNGFLYRPLPVPGGGDLVAIFTSDFGARELRGGSSHKDLASFASSAAGVAELAGESRVTFGIGRGDRVELVPGALVSTGYWSTLQATPALGRLPRLVRDDEPTIVLGHALWRRAFASDAAIVGKQVTVNGHFFTVAAVAPPRFLGTLREQADEFWIDAAFAPLLMPHDAVLTDRRYRSFHLVGRMHDGATVQELEARLGMVASRLANEEPDAWRDSTGRGRRVTAMPEREARVAGVPESDLVLLVGGVVALGLALLAVASTNLASMQMARTAARRREIATRLALGAGRARLVRQLVAESALVAVPGALLGLAMAATASRAAMHWRPAGLPNIDMTLDPRALVFVAGGLLLVLLVFGLVPALQGVRGDLLTDLKGGAAPGRGGIRIGGVRGGLIVAQVALSVTFTAGSGLVALALARHAEDSLVDGTRVLVAPLTLLPAAGDSVRAPALVREVVERLARIPGVAGVSAAYHVPVPGERMTVAVDVRGAAAASDARAASELDANMILPRYFAVAGLPLLRGRDFRDGDMSRRAGVAIVSTRMAERLWPGDDPIGKRLRVGRDPAATSSVEIVGVVGELRAARPGDANGLLYLPLAPGAEDRLVLHVRANGPASTIASSVARELRRLDARVLAPEAVTMERWMERATMPARITARVSALLAVLQLTLAIAGLSGLVAYVTTLRRREIGIRSALGASRAHVVALVMRLAVRLTAIGGAIGIVLSLALGKVVAATLPMNASIELRALAAAVVGFALVAGAAMLFPARRALAVPPATSLRVD